MTRLDRIELRVTEKERDRWQAAAEREGCSRAEFVDAAVRAYRSK